MKLATGRRQDSSDREVLAGLVERVTFHNPESGFYVLRTRVRGYRDLVMVVGHAAMVAPGEWITASGEWVDNRIRLPSADDDYRLSAGGLHSAITMAGAARKVICECRVRGSDGCAVVVNDDKYGPACAGVGLNPLAFCLRKNTAGTAATCIARER